jgi:peptide/nickel transport system permease protein
VSLAPTTSPSAAPLGSDATIVAPAGWGPRARFFFFGTPLAGVASVCLLALIALAVLGPLVWRKDPAAVDVASALRPPSAAHPMGTDGSGRDIFTRFNHGARLSLIVAPLIAIAGAAVGGLLGIVAGVFGGRLDSVLMRLMDAILAFPPLILAMAVTVGLGVGVTTAAIGIVLTSIPWYARLLRSDALSIRSRPFIEAARALGADRRRIVRRHVLPHVVPTLLVQGASVFGYAILTLAALGFVGLGAQPPTAEWGAMITDGLQYAITGQWWIGVFPGIGVLLAVTGANVLADRVRDVLDPRSEARA